MTTENNAADPIVSLTLPLQQVNLILGALQELPHKTVDVVLKNIVVQAESQLKAAAEAAPQQETTEEAPVAAE